MAVAHAAAPPRTAGISDAFSFRQQRYPFPPPLALSVTLYEYFDSVLGFIYISSGYCHGTNGIVMMLHHAANDGDQESGSLSNCQRPL